MAKIKVELISEGVRALLRSDEMMAICRQEAEARASRIADAELSEYVGQNRVNVSISTTYDEADDLLRTL